MKKTAAPSNLGHTTNQSIRVRDYVDTALKTFSLYDNVRSIPRLTDGFKPSQRKSVCGALHRGENAGEMQLERLASLIAAHTDYHHGASSLVGTIVGMANDKMPGMNNMNVFDPSGQFGSRLTDEPGAGRYIFTRLNSNFREMFKKEDDCILDPIVVDGEEIEPRTYIPLLPMPLVNGAQGTGTGHATNIMSYHPLQLRDALVSLLDGKKLKAGKLTPWFRGYHGEVARNPETGQITTTGVYEITNSTTIRITELPLGVYHDTYVQTLNALEEAQFIKGHDSRSTEESFEFIIDCPRSTTALDHETLLKKFKLIGRDTENFTLWNVAGVLQRFESAESIIEAFLPWRLERYEDRRKKLIEETAENIRFQSEVVRFIKFYLANTKVFKDTSKKELIELLLANKFVDYDRLLGMPIWNLTKDKIAELEKKLADLKAYLASLKADTASDMYRRELKAFKYEG